VFIWFGFVWLYSSTLFAVGITVIKLRILKKNGCGMYNRLNA
jgi:hypothetical protein